MSVPAARVRPWLTSVTSSLPIALVCGLVTLQLIAFGIGAMSRQRVESFQEVQRSLLVEARAVQLRADFETAVSSGFAVQVTSGEGPGVRFQEARAKIGDDLAGLRELSADNAEHTASLNALDTMLDTRMKLIDQAIDAGRRGDEPARDTAVQAVQQSKAQILAPIGEIERAARLRSQAYEKALRASRSWWIASLVVGCILGLASVALALANWLTSKRERAHLAELSASEAMSRRSELALRESEARFRITAENIPDLLLETDANGDGIYANAKLFEYTGLDTVPSKDTTLQLIHPDDRAHRAEAWARARRDGAAFELEWRCRRHDGVFRWFLVRAVPVRDATGTVVRWVSTAADIDDQKRAATVLVNHRDELERLVNARTAELAAREAELRETAARFRLITEHTNDMVSRVGPDGEFLYVSPACQRLFGVPPAQFTAKTLFDLVHADDGPNLFAWRARLATGLVDTDVITYRIKGADGAELWVESSAHCLRDANTGKPDGFVSVLRDVSDRKRLEQSLLQAQKMEVVGRISAGVAHDFSNILQTVVSGLELNLQATDLNHPSRDFAHLALGAAKRGSYLTKHLLSYARRQVLQPRVLELDRIIPDLQRLLARTLGPHIRVRTDLAVDTAPIEVDPNQLQTALLNLAINGADAMPEGGDLTIAVDSVARQGDERTVTLRVIDNGTGMDAATLAQACDPFFTTKGVEGTGLGLSMVQGFVEQSGGTMHIDSTLGLGTTVTLLFPAASGPVTRPIDLASMPQPSRRVLVVDDEPDILVTAGAFLEHAGLWVVRASSGNEALALLAGTLPFDALVTDYAMPGMNGADLAAESQLVRPGLPVVIISGFAEVKGIERLSGHVQILGKPFLRAELLRALSQAMHAGAPTVSAKDEA